MTVASNKKNGGFFISLSTDVGGFYDAGEDKKRKYGSIVSDKAMEGSLKTYSLKEEADNAAMMSAEGDGPPREALGSTFFTFCTFWALGVVNLVKK